MKKGIILSALSLCLVALSGKAQSSLVVTLADSSGVQVYYGSEAFRNAVSDATVGGVITLSSGFFSAAEIDKPLTIRGAGMDVVPEDTAAYGKSTVLVGDFDVTADQRQGHKFLMEGVCSDDEVTLRGISGARFVKCRFGNVGFEANHGSLRGVTFVHCYVSNSFSSLYNTTFEAWNSCFKGARMDGRASVFSLRNCVLETSNPRNDLSSTTLENCIIINTGEDATAYMDNSSVLYSVWVGPGRENPFPNVPTNYSNSVVREAEQLFSAGTFYQLAAGEGEFTGSDGTEVGLYGGQLPFSPTPSNPQIVKFSVASETDAEGKLSIDIEVQ